MEGSGGERCPEQHAQLGLPAPSVHAFREHRARRGSEGDDARHLLDQHPGELLIEGADDESPHDLFAVADRSVGEGLEALLHGCSAQPIVLRVRICVPGPRTGRGTFEPGRRAGRRQVRARQHRVPGRGTLRQDLNIVAVEEDLDGGDVDKRERQQLIANRLGGLLETRLGRALEEALGERRPNARLEHQLRLSLAQLRDISGDAHVARDCAARATPRRDTDLEVTHGPLGDPPVDDAGPPIDDAGPPVDLADPSASGDDRPVDVGDGGRAPHVGHHVVQRGSEEVRQSPARCGYEGGIGVDHAVVGVGDDDAVGRLLDDCCQLVPFPREPDTTGHVVKREEEPVAVRRHREIQEHFLGRQRGVRTWQELPLRCIRLTGLHHLAAGIDEPFAERLSDRRGQRPADEARLIGAHDGASRPVGVLHPEVRDRAVGGPDRCADHERIWHRVERVAHRSVRSRESSLECCRCLRRVHHATAATGVSRTGPFALVAHLRLGGAARRCPPGRRRHLEGVPVPRQRCAQAGRAVKASGPDPASASPGWRRAGPLSARTMGHLACFERCRLVFRASLGRHTRLASTKPAGV